MAEPFHDDMPARAAARLRRLGWILAAGVIALLAVAAWQSMRRSAGMLAALTPTGAEQTVPGAEIKWVIEIAAADATGTLRATRLIRISDTSYARSADEVVVHETGRTRIAMGTASDLRPGAVVYVAGVARSDREADVGKIAILTGYVQVHDGAAP